MSINVFKEHPGNKVTFSDRSVFFCGEHKVVGSRPKVIFCVHSIVWDVEHVVYCTLHW